MLKHNWRPPLPGQRWMRWKSCLWCREGDMAWDYLRREWCCVQCGWLDWESLRQDHQDAVKIWENRERMQHHQNETRYTKVGNPNKRYGGRK